MAIRSINSFGLVPSAAVAGRALCLGEHATPAEAAVVLPASESTFESIADSHGPKGPSSFPCAIPGRDPPPKQLRAPSTSSTPAVPRFPWNSVKAMAASLLPSRRPVDYPAIITPGCRLILLGERHVRLGPKEECLHLLKLVAAMGFTHFGLEMLDSDRQTDLDAYVGRGDKQARRRIAAFLNETWKYADGAAAPKYMQLIDTAKALGMKVLALDKPPSRANNSSAATLSDVVAESQRRDDWMANVIKRVLSEDSSARLLVFTGAAHTPGLDELVPASGGERVSIFFAGGLAPLPGSLALRLDRAAQRARIAKERFMLASDKVSGPHADWIVHLPQVEDATQDDRRWANLRNMARAFRQDMVRRPYPDQPIEVGGSFVSMNREGKRFVFQPGSGLQIYARTLKGKHSMLTCKDATAEEILQFRKAMAASIRSSPDGILKHFHDAYLKRYR